MAITSVDRIRPRNKPRRAGSEVMETTVIIALAGLVLFKGVPAMAGIALATGLMMAELLRVLIAG